VASCYRRVQETPKATSSSKGATQGERPHLLIKSHVSLSKDPNASSKMGALIVGRSPHHQSIIAHDVIINMLNVQGEKANVQGGKWFCHLSKRCPIISKCNILKSKSNVALGCTAQSVGLPSHLIANLELYLSIIQSLGGVGRCPKVCPTIRRCNVLYQGCNVLCVVQNVMGVMIKTSSKGPCQVHHGQRNPQNQVRSSIIEIQESLESYKVSHHLIQKPNKQFTLGIFFKLHTNSRLYAIWQV
jgi:hypothetical protein